MKKFRFKLEPYLKILEIEKKKKLAELSQIASELNIRQQEIHKYSEESTHWLSKTEELRITGKLSPQVLQMRTYIYSYLENLKKNKEKAQRELASLQEKFKEKQQEAIQARLKVRTVEILREKKLAQHHYELSREETKQLDEFNTNTQKGERHATDSFKTKI